MIEPGWVFLLSSLLAASPVWDGPQELRDALADPYRNVRRRAVDQLSEQLLENGSPIEPFLEDPSARVRSAAARALLRRSDLQPPQDLLARLVRDRDSRVRRAILDVLVSRDQDQSEPFRSQLGEQDRVLRLYYDHYLVGRARSVFESLIHDGTIPGFYDGQFSALWPLDPRMAERLIEVAVDERFHYVMRVLAIMALHETRRPTLEEDLQPLLLDPEEEFRIARQEWFSPRGSNPEIVALRRRADLSRYARFSLAKAGKIGPILRIIQRMDQELQAYSRDLESRSTDDLYAEHFREWLRTLLFESGYYFQQFDDYDRANERYLRLVEKYPESRSCQSAYYNLACIASIRKLNADSLRYLRRAVELGFTDYEWLLEDGDLQSVRKEAEFQRILEQARTGQLQDMGRTWLAILTPELPPGRSLFELDRLQQQEVLQRAAPKLNEAEVESLLKAAPQGQREWLAALIQRLRGRPTESSAEVPGSPP
jgi:hypothetical protein